MASAESVGTDRRTGATLSGWEHVVQSFEDIFTTAYFTRVMRPHYGSMATRLFGELANPRTAQRFRFAVALGMSLFEPRFTPLTIGQVDLDRTGATAWIIDGIYRPYALLGDPTPAGRRSLMLAVTGDGVRVSG
jgi:phage baseplate assembly protein W